MRFRSLLKVRPEWQVVGEACDRVAAVQRASELRPDLVLLDVGMPGLNGIDAAKRIRRISPESKIIFVTQDGDADVRSAALATGAAEYLIKTNVVRELLPAVDALLS